MTRKRLEIGLKPLKIVPDMAAQNRWYNENPCTFMGGRRSQAEMLDAIGEHAYRIDKAGSIMSALRLIEALADEYTGRDTLALLDRDYGEEAEAILAAYQGRKPAEPTS